MANVVAAIVAGADSIDCTLRGLGRSSGNAQTEAVALVLQSFGLPHRDRYAGHDPGCGRSHRNSFPGYGNAGIDLATGFAGLHSRFVDDINRIAEEYDIEPIDLLLAVGERGEQPIASKSSSRLRVV